MEMVPLRHIGCNSPSWHGYAQAVRSPGHRVPENVWYDVGQEGWRKERLRCHRKSKSEGGDGGETWGSGRGQWVRAD